MEIFATTNRTLENFLYVHACNYLGSSYDDDKFLTVWKFENNDYTKEIRAEFDEMKAYQADLSNEFAHKAVAENYEVMNRNLEKFLYLHGILAERTYTNEDHQTVWVYKYTELLESVVAEFRSLKTVYMNSWKERQKTRTA